VSALFRNLVRFGRVLDEAGLDVHAGKMIEAARALDHVDIARRQDFFHALRTVLVHRPTDLPIFDAAFDDFWREHRAPSDLDLRAMGRQRRREARPLQSDGSVSGASDRDGSPPGDLEATVNAAMSYAATEILKSRDFADLSDEELSAARRLIALLRWHPGTRRTRRRRPGRSGDLDLRRVARANVRFGGEPIRLPARVRLERPRPTVVVADVSGSMERYSSMLLHFMHGLCASPAGRGLVEAFVFATRLTRVTHELARYGAERAAQSSAFVPDWGGGTRIGAALRTFNTHWARRMLARSPVVVLISDGWDRGDPDVLARETARLQRSCHRLIWLNPLIGTPGYQPLTRGLQAALPFVDEFLPAHNVASLEQLLAVLTRPTADRRSRPDANKVTS
jgi:uncharacterized protein with von Willebrand factor type A (vWA) domain